MSDIHAVLGTPAWATVTVGLPHDDAARGHLATVLAGVADALFAEGVVFAGGHSVYSTDLFVNIAVSGLAHERRSAPSPCPGDAIILTKPLGTGIALAALKLGLTEESELEDVFGLLKESNGPVARLLKETISTDSSAVKTVTDISGFGFLQAAALATGTATAIIDGPTVPRIDDADRFMAAGAFSPLTDKNLLSSELYTSFGEMDSAELAALRVLLNDPQTSGGLLAVLSPAAARHLLDSARCFRTPPVIVGRIVELPADGEVALRLRVSGSASSYCSSD